MTVTTSELGSARVVTWDRQAKRNAWTRETIEAIADGIETAGADERVRCVVARGAGEHFLPSTMGETGARELLLTGALRDVEWAQRHRFVNEVVPAAEFDARIAA